jgi:DNA-binding SARP family transcriptional activator/tetratricopeptide (TPR) repeat protein
MTSLFGVAAGVDALLGILGSTALLLDGEVTDTWGKPRERAVLATLAVHVNRVVSINTLIRWAWPADKPVPQNPADTFHLYAARIRRALRQLPTPARLLAGHGGYRLEMDRSQIDHFRFRELMAEATGQEPERAVPLIDRALTLFRGSPLADLSSPSAEAWRTGVVQNQLLAANTMLIEQLLTTRRFDEAITRLDDLHADYPDDVTLATLRLTALFGARRSTHATSVYFAMRRRLVRGGDTQAAEHLRLHHDALWAEHTSGHRPTPAATPHQLPPAHRCFVGRTELLDLLDAATNIGEGPHSGVVAVDGAGGVGKTSLVVHWAHRHRHLFPGGDLFVNMHGYADRAIVEHTTVVDDFLSALGQSPDASLPAPAREQLLSSLLNGRKTLVVLDNARDTEHVRGLLPLLTDCLVLITSRQLLVSLRTETGAQQITVPPMNERESTELLSAQLGPRSELAENHRTGLAELCGGLPLLLTVLAGNLAKKSDTAIDEYAALVNRRQLVLGVGEQGDGPTSGAACFEPSYLALAPAERRLFRLLTLHPGPEFGLAAARACGGGSLEDTARGLGRLTGAHLLEEADPVNRYRFHDVLGEFAAYCRDRDEPPDEQDAAARRVLDFYVDAATHACGTVHRSYNPPPEPPAPTGPVTSFDDADEARRWFARERTNLTSAITYAAEHDHHDHAWRLTDPVTTFFDRAGANVDSRTVRMIALRSTRATGNREGESSILGGLGMTYMKLGDIGAARRCLNEAIRLAVEEQLPRGQAANLHLLGRVALRQGHVAEALDLFHRGMVIDLRSGNHEGLCWAHCRIGQALHAVDQHGQALPHLHEASRLAHEIGETSAEATSLWEIGAIHHELGDLATAIDNCEKALAIAESVPNLPVIAEICAVLCEINSSRHRSRQAIAFGRRAVEVCQRTRDLAQHARALEVLGDAQHACGDLVDAVVAWRQAADLHGHNTAKAARLRGKIDAVPVFYQEIVPIAREPHQARAPGAWPAEEEVTRPLE